MYNTCILICIFKFAVSVTYDVRRHCRNMSLKLNSVVHFKIQNDINRLKQNAPKFQGVLKNVKSETKNMKVRFSIYLVRRLIFWRSYEFPVFYFPSEPANNKVHFMQEIQAWTFLFFLSTFHDVKTISSDREDGRGNWLENRNCEIGCKQVNTNVALV